MNDKRAQLRVLAAAISTAATLTVAYISPGIPNEILIAWGGVFMAGVGVAEGIVDNRPPGEPA